MPTSKKKKIARRVPRKITMVEFEIPELFEGTFELPDLNQIPVGVARRIQGEDALDEIAALFEKNGCHAELEVFDDLDRTEVETFIEAWQKASGIDIPKSDG